MVEETYSAGLISQSFWFVEMKKVIKLIDYGKSEEEIKKMYFEISYSIEQLLVNDGIKYTYKEYKNLDDYINRLKSSYGGQTEKYIKNTV